MNARHGGAHAVFLAVSWRRTTLRRPPRVVGPPREVFEVLLAGVKPAKRVSKNRTIEEEEDWTTERQAAWGNTRDTLQESRNGCRL